MLEYTPYHGPAGPEEDDVTVNNLEILKAGKVLGLEGEIKSNPDLDDADEVIFTKDGKEVTRIGYDRWGYCDDKGELDQSSIQSAVQHLIKMLKTCN